MGADGSDVESEWARMGTNERLAVPETVAASGSEQEETRRFQRVS